MFQSFGALIYRGRWVVIALGLVAAGAAAVLDPGVFGRLDTGGFQSKNFESQQAQQAITEHFGSDESLIVLFQSKDGLKVTSTAYMQAVGDTLGKVRNDSGVSSIVDYYHTGVPKLVSKDGTSTYAVINLKGNNQDAMAQAKRLRPLLTSSTLQVETGGVPAINADFTHQISEDLAKSEIISFAVLAILLVIVFRSLVAALLPLLLGAFGVVSAFLVVWGLTYVTTISQYAINVIILLGLGLSIDYSLFMVSRFREELRERPVREALQVTMRTAGRTVLFSGLTVILSLLGLLIFPINFLKSMGYGASAAVAVAVVGALTVLPALMAVLGNRINALSFGRVRADYQAIKAGRAVTPERRTFWYNVARWAMRRPALTIGIVMVPLVFAGQLVLQSNFSSADYRSLPVSASSRKAADALANNFPGGSQSPIQVVIHTPTDRPDQAELATYQGTLRGLPGVTGVAPGGSKQVAGYTVLNVSYNAVYDQTLARDLVAQVRDTARPSSWNVKVGGETAMLVDLLASLRHYSWRAGVLVAGALVLLLLIMFRSVVVPLLALFVNVLALSATFGILVWVFQKGHLTRWLDFHSVGALDATQPVLIFGIAFGLSMDYSVFLLSRIKEQYDHTGNTTDSIAEGVQKTGTIITSAAVLFIVVVGAFATSKIQLIKEVGMGLGLAVFIDAFLIRMLLVPALMKILGRANWWPSTRPAALPTSAAAIAAEPRPSHPEA